MTEAITRPPLPPFTLEIATQKVHSVWQSQPSDRASFVSRYAQQSLPGGRATRARSRRALSTPLSHGLIRAPVRHGRVDHLAAGFSAWREVARK